jgi:sortase A
MRSALITTLTWVLVACGVIVFAHGALDYWESKHAQTEMASEWEHFQLPEKPASAVRPPNLESAPPSAPPRPGMPVAELSIPRLESVLYVVEGDDARDLKRGPGHVIGSAMPGQDGNCIIAGHRDTHFRILKDIHKGDEILLTRDGETFRYRVDETRVISPRNLEPLRPTREPVLNLITCFPFYYVGAAPKRFVVHATLEQETLRAAR